MSGTEPLVSGVCHDQFEAVRKTFAENFALGDVGAAFAVYVDGELVVDLCGGVTEPGGSAPYRDHHLQLVFSSTKGATALCAHRLSELGLLDLDAPVAEYWPEFAANGKAHVPVWWLLSHRAGLPDVETPMSLDDVLAWDPVVEALADATPMWAPGTQRGYHAVTFGFLVGEVVRRVTGWTIGQFFRDEVAAPLGLDFWIGLPEAEHDRVVPIRPIRLPDDMYFGDPDAPQPGMVEMLALLTGPDSPTTRALSAPGGALRSDHVWNLPEVWSAEIPAANGIGDARSLARMYAAMIGEVDGVRVLGDAALRRALRVRSTGPDVVLLVDVPWGEGFMRDSDFAGFGSPTGFGHYGAGGSVGGADPYRGVAFSYVMNQMEHGITGDSRGRRLIDALFECLDG